MQLHPLLVDEHLQSVLPVLGKFQYGKESVNLTFLHDRKPLVPHAPEDQNVGNLHLALFRLIQVLEIYPSLLASHVD